MKMKAIVIAGLLLGSLAISAQQIQNTSWKTYNTFLMDTVTVIAQTDTFFVNNSVGVNMVTALFEESNDTMQIFDVSGPGACTDPDTGWYTFTIMNDTLRFSIIVDSCASRSGQLDGAELWRYDMTTSAQSIELEEENVMVYPNPFTNGFFIELNETAQVRIIDVSGKIIDQSLLTEGRHFIDWDLPSGMYIIQVHSNEAITEKRLYKR